MRQSALDKLDRRGYAVVPGLVPPDSCREIFAVFDENRGCAGRRDGLEHSCVRRLSTSAAVSKIVSSVLGPRAFAVRVTLFDKTPETNWLVPWHQDVMIPVRARCDVPGFEAWSIKDDVQHVRPPVGVLCSMLAVRIDLDGSDGGNGPLRVIGGTHLDGFLNASEIQRIVAGKPAIECHVPAGGALLMRPLLLHASSKALAPKRRRILHLEFAAEDLPGGLTWYDRFAPE